MSPVRLLMLAAVCVVLAGTAHADFLFTWDLAQPHVSFGSDPDDPNSITVGPGHDIFTGIWWGMNQTNFAFRIDLQAAPSITDAADYYGIYLDTTPGFGTSGGTIPAGLTDIDWRLVAQWNDLSGDFDTITAQQWNGTQWVTMSIPGLTFQNDMNSGMTLEWLLPISAMPPLAYDVYAGTMDTGSPNFTTFDIAGPIHTPEPTTLALLGLGLGGIFLKRRRKA